MYCTLFHPPSLLICTTPPSVQDVIMQKRGLPRSGISSRQTCLGFCCHFAVAYIRVRQTRLCHQTTIPFPAPMYSSLSPLITARRLVDRGRHPSTSSIEKFPWGSPLKRKEAEDSCTHTPLLADNTAVVLRVCLQCSHYKWVQSWSVPSVCRAEPVNAVYRCLHSPHTPYRPTRQWQWQ